MPSAVASSPIGVGYVPRILGTEPACGSCLTLWILSETQLVGLQISFSSSVSVRRERVDFFFVGEGSQGSVDPGP